jgi:hypothetical protein
MIRLLAAFVLVSALSTSTAAAQIPLDPGSGATAPIPPETLTRDEKGRAVLRAVRVQSPIRIDGRLDDDVYTRVPGAGDFIQQVPEEGKPATEQTEVWVFYDDENLYFSARCFDSRPDRISGNELRRDNGNVFRLNDTIVMTLDTFHDLRNGYSFQTNPIGALRDQAINDGSQNDSWNTVWDVRTARFEQGFTAEFVIPFKSLRYRNAGPQVWGINVRRIVKWKNEVSFITPVPASYNTGGVAQMNVAATLVGLETPAQSMNLEFKPYASSSVTTDRTARVPVENDYQPNGGLDLKYGLTRGLTADLTFNTDFAQVEEDQQQVNLTRFSLFFPEKRDFFLEGQGIFDFGGQSSRSASGANPILFFSRRIGLSNGQSVPVTAGGRVTGNAGKFDVGALVINTGDKASAGAVSTTFSAARVRRNILRRSSVGLLATGRWPAVSAVDQSSTVGADVDLRFFENIQANGYWAQVASPGVDGDNTSYRARFNYGADRYGLELDRLVVNRLFNPEVGFVRRTDFALTSATVRFSPRLRQSRLIRRLSWTGDLEYITNAAGARMDDRTLTGTFNVEFNSSDEIQVSANRRFERLPLDFGIAPGVTVPAGAYLYDTVRVEYVMATQRKLVGNLSASRGSFYGGTRTTAEYTSGRFGFNAHLAVEPTVTVNWVDLPYGRFTARLVGTRFVVTPSARLAFSSLTQFNPTAHTLSSSVRMRWDYIPGSEMFVVYSDGRDTAAERFPLLQNRSFAVKITRLLRF